mmetsp:Transcript_20494/g.48082  ORF Transcript_20494/g.48082 Transcript_20494/m.48082 type:complete len:238 (-) Transcript_20494:203-916(-)
MVGEGEPLGTPHGDPHALFLADRLLPGVPPGLDDQIDVLQPKGIDGPEAGPDVGGVGGILEQELAAFGSLFQDARDALEAILVDPRFEGLDGSGDRFGFQLFVRAVGVPEFLGVEPVLAGFLFHVQPNVGGDRCAVVAEPVVLFGVQGIIVGFPVQLGLGFAQSFLFLPADAVPCLFALFLVLVERAVGCCCSCCCCCISICAFSRDAIRININININIDINIDINTNTNAVDAAGK